VTAARPAHLDALTVALNLHPTPALLGTPRAEALAAVAALESEPRSWFGGFAGVLSATGDGCGELAVLLRGAERCSGGWRTWAGSGLVQASHEADERDEVDRKHRAIAAGLGLEDGP
jgi:isochorismate synthase EntC